MTKARDLPDSVVLDMLGRVLFGDDWAAPVGRLIGVHRSVLNRVRSAASVGREYATAGGLRRRLEAELLSIADDVHGGKHMRMNWEKARLRGRLTEEASPKGDDAKGGWTHVKREPCRKLTPAEVEKWKREHGMK